MGRLDFRLPNWISESQNKFRFNTMGQIYVDNPRSIQSSTALLKLADMLALCLKFILISSKWSLDPGNRVWTEVSEGPGLL
jgi:hypothetical protein